MDISDNNQNSLRIGINRHFINKGQICRLTFLSQPLHFIGVFILFHGAMAIYFIAAAEINTTYLVISTSVLYGITTILHLALAFVNPGVIPKIASQEI